MLKSTELNASLGDLSSPPKATSTDVVFSLAFCFTSLWLIMKVSVNSMQPQMAPTPQVAQKGIRGAVGSGLFQGDPRGNERCGCGWLSLPLSHLLSWHPRPTSGVPASSSGGVRLRFATRLLLCKVGADKCFRGTPPKSVPAGKTDLEYPKVPHKA